MELKPIGFVKSCYLDKFGTPRQSGLVPAATAELRILPEFQPELSLQGLSEFSHLWLIFHFHKNTNLVFRPKVHPPRLGGDTTGVFASRSPHRPNPLGLSLAKIEKVEGSLIWLSGLDLIDETPVFDIKPYLPTTEALPQAKGAWTDQKQDIEIDWEPEALGIMKSWSESSKRPQLRELIESTIKLDPRPVVYRGFEGVSDPKYRQIHAVRLFEGDVKFQFLEPNKARIVQIIPHYMPGE